MRILIFSITFLLLITISLSQIDPPKWPLVFSQSMAVNFGTYNTTGKFWYNYNILGQRYDFANGQSDNACGLMYKQPTSCTLLIRNNTMYINLPEKNLCCSMYGIQVFPPNWLQLMGFTYAGEVQFGWQRFYSWAQKDQPTHYLYYADETVKRIPKRFSRGQDGDFTLDFWASTYSQFQMPNSVFDPPSTCTRSCLQLKKQKQNNLSKEQ